MTGTTPGYFRRFFRDSIFVRVCVFIYGSLFLSCGAAILIFFMPSEPLEWFLTAFALVCLGFGAFMAYAAVFGRLRLLERASEGVSDGSEVIGILFMMAVLVAAFPITVLVKFARSLRKRS